MALTPTLTLPLPSAPDTAYTKLWAPEVCSEPAETTEEFERSIYARDANACAVCNMPGPAGLDHCRIIPEEHTWEFMRNLRYIPCDAKAVSHETRNGVLLCVDHAWAFENYYFYIRWNPETDEFYVVNHSQANSVCEAIHGNVLNFKFTTTKQCPFPTAFLWHEARVRAFNPTCGDRPVILKRGDQRGEYFSPSCIDVVVDDDGAIGYHVDAFTPSHMNFGTPAFATWLRAAQKSEMWKSCMMESTFSMMEDTFCNGTVEENVEQYKRECLSWD